MKQKYTRRSFFYTTYIFLITIVFLNKITLAKNVPVDDGFDDTIGFVRKQLFSDFPKKGVLRILSEFKEVDIGENSHNLRSECSSVESFFALSSPNFKISYSDLKVRWESGKFPYFNQSITHCFDGDVYMVLASDGVNKESGEVSSKKTAKISDFQPAFPGYSYFQTGLAFFSSTILDKKFGPLKSLFEEDPAPIISVEENQKGELIMTGKGAVKLGAIKQTTFVELVFLKDKKMALKSYRYERAINNAGNTRTVFRKANIVKHKQILSEFFVPEKAIYEEGVNEESKIRIEWLAKNIDIDENSISLPQLPPHTEVTDERLGISFITGDMPSELETGKTDN